MLTLITILGLVAIYFIMTYNRIISLKEAVHNNKHEISIQLDRRSKVFDSLINTVKKAMDYENSTFSKIVELRNSIKNISSKDISNEDRMKAEEELSQVIKSGQLESSLNILVENYPDLKANDNMKILQEEIISTENKLSYAKQAYNDSIELYNAKIKSFIESFIVDKFKDKLYEEFTYWKLSEDKIENLETGRVNF